MRPPAGSTLANHSTIPSKVLIPAGSAASPSQAALRILFTLIENAFPVLMSTCADSELRFPMPSANPQGTEFLQNTGSLLLSAKREGKKMFRTR